MKLPDLSNAYKLFCDDILFKILIYLPLGDLIAFRIVNSKFKNIIDPIADDNLLKILKMHYIKTLGDYDDDIKKIFREKIMNLTKDENDDYLKIFKNLTKEENDDYLKNFKKFYKKNQLNQVIEKH